MSHFPAAFQERLNCQKTVHHRDSTEHRRPHVDEGIGQGHIVDGWETSDLFKNVKSVSLYEEVWEKDKCQRMFNSHITCTKYVTHTQYQEKDGEAHADRQIYH